MEVNLMREVKGFNVYCTPLTQAQYLILELLLPQVILRLRTILQLKEKELFHHLSHRLLLFF